MNRSPAQKAWMKELLRRIKSRSTGMKGTRPWRIWTGLRNRCLNPNCKDYPRYGGSGIQVCPEWAHFKNFWSDMADGYADHLQIDRINPLRGYCKENCRWVTVKQQQRNRRDCVTINTPRGPMLLVEAAEAYGLPYGRVKMRRQCGWSDADIISDKKPYVRR